jgi:hypothetical protein
MGRLVTLEHAMYRGIFESWSWSWGRGRLSCHQV